MAGPVMMEEPVEIMEEEDWFSGSISTGYDTEYYFRGDWLGDKPIWTGIDLAFALPGGFEFAPGLWYINPTETGGQTDELDIYATLSNEIYGIGYGIGYAMYTYPEASISPDNEGSIFLGYTLFDLIDLSAALYYGEVGTANNDYTYGEFGIGTGYDLGLVALSLSYTYGDLLDGGDRSATNASLGDTNHNVTFGVDIPITETATVSAYVAYIVSNGIEDSSEDDTVVGGVSLSVGF